MRSKVHKMMWLIVLFFWVVTQCELIGRYQGFGETYFSPEGGDGIYLQIHMASQPIKNIVRSMNHLNVFCNFKIYILAYIITNNYTASLHLYVSACMHTD
jgi:hypothetical protein